MKQIKVMSVFGTRPEAIKMAPLVKALEKDERFESIVCVTAQHREMLDSVLDIFDIKPQYDLNIMAHGQTIIDISNKVLKGVDEVIKQVEPNIVLVHGDTSTTLNGALAAFYNKVPVGHVEEGLRSYDIYSPFPEEMNRKLTGGITELHFAPTKTNQSNLLLEGVNKQKIHVTGNTVIDALLSVVNENHKLHVEAGLRSYDIYSPFPEEMNRKLTGGITELHFAPTKTNQSNLLLEGINKQKIHVTGNTVIDALLSVVNENHKFEDEILNNIDFNNKKVILLTTHRRENWGQPMENIFKAMIELIENNEDVEIIFPMHKNPSIRELAHRYFDKYIEKVHLIEPLEYVEFTNLMSKVYLIMTDSGGIQEEAPALGKPVMVLRTDIEEKIGVNQWKISLKL